MSEVADDSDMNYPYLRNTSHLLAGMSSTDYMDIVQIMECSVALDLMKYILTIKSLVKE